MRNFARSLVALAVWKAVQSTGKIIPWSTFQEGIDAQIRLSLGLNEGDKIPSETAAEFRVLVCQGLFENVENGTLSPVSFVPTKDVEGNSIGNELALVHGLRTFQLTETAWKAYQTYKTAPAATA